MFGSFNPGRVSAAFTAAAPSAPKKTSAPAPQRPQMPQMPPPPASNITNFTFPPPEPDPQVPGIASASVQYMGLSDSQEIRCD